MFEASRHTLVLLAAVVWYTGGLVLVVKGGGLMATAESLDPGQGWTWGAAAAGMALGILKARLLFRGACRNNLIRIAAFERPRLWQFYRLRFFLFLLLMIAASGFLTRAVDGSYFGIIAVAALDLSIATALMVGGAEFITGQNSE